MRAWDKVAKMFGVVGPSDETDGYTAKHQAAWDERRRRFLNRRCGKLKDVPSSEAELQACSKESAQQDRLPGHASEHQEPLHIGARETRQKRQARWKGQKQKSFDEHPSSRASTVAQADKARGESHSPLTASFIATRTHAPFNRTTSETGTHLANLKPQQHPQDTKHLEEDNGSYDLTDFDAKESIAKLVNDVLAKHQEPRAFGMGLVGKLLSRKFRKDLTKAQFTAIHSFNDHRPYFTYWVTTVQILIMIITLLTYGFGPIGFSETLVKGTVYVSSLTWQQESYYEHDNIWLGPRPLDLIHLGAKFTPCMRRDSLIYKEIHQDREDERTTGCCIRNDQSGCLQTQKGACTELSRWHSWNESIQTSSSSSSLLPVPSEQIDTATSTTSNSKRRKSGPVCGQDPQYCLTPASTYPHEWPDDITKWPICQERIQTTKQSHHMSCEVIGRPCCIGIYGQCRLTTSQHCQFLRGTFHPEATLCSQVSCMEDVCGMVPFYARDYPDQFYRLITALFLHAGLIHLAFTVIIQYYIMRDIERLLGSTRMAIIYFLSGVAGYLASATFVPYHTQVGPSGSQFALLASLMAETINSWRYLENPFGSLWKLISIAIGLFFLGLLPWIDNYAHIFGFIVGLLLSLALTPYLTPFSDAYSRRKKVIQIWVCIMLVILIFVLLPLPLYIFPLYECSWCQYLDCWPLAPNWCKNQDIKVTRLDTF